jgi:hypothetical protein
MKEYTQEELEGLISCPKIIVDPPKREMMSENRYLRNSMRLESEDSEYIFSVFLRKSSKFSEDFSVGLIFHPIDQAESVDLIRCNSKHPGKSDPVHFQFHIHWIVADDLNNGIRKLRNRKTTKEYGSFEEAIQYFSRLVKIKDADTDLFLSALLQTSIFDTNGEQK